MNNTNGTPKTLNEAIQNGLLESFDENTLKEFPSIIGNLHTHIEDFIRNAIAPTYMGINSECGDDSKTKQNIVEFMRRASK